ncbi:MAG: twin-arginine translocase TatA/TatE family subunit [Deltaproteobacteria bacterium]|nr:twin-arginine translocase TatA/TatE family subunit [Deltaproteobacteria bacterium]
MMPGTSELLIILGVAVLLFGPSKLPKLGAAIGESIRNFRRGVRPDESDADKDSQPKQIPVKKNDDPQDAV